MVYAVHWDCYAAFSGSQRHGLSAILNLNQGSEIMSLYSQCGDEVFCKKCGSRIAPAASAPPRRKGCGLAIVGQIMGIVSLTTSVFFFFLSIMVTVQGSSSLITFFIILAFCSPFCLLAIFFGSAARRQGFYGNMSKNSLSFGGTGAAVFAISMLIIFVKMWK